MLQRPDGSVVAVALTGAPLLVSGEVVGAVLAFHDMTREEDYIERLSWQASHDALTGLANRRDFESRLERTIVELQGQPRQHALMYLDLDQFKLVNDTCGHAAGDQLLRQISVLLPANCGRATRWPGWAATSSACCSRTVHRETAADTANGCADRAGHAFRLG